MWWDNKQNYQWLTSVYLSTCRVSWGGDCHLPPVFFLVSQRPSAPNAGLVIMTIESGYCLAVQMPSLPGRFLLYSCPKLEPDSEKCTPKLQL